MHPVEALLRPVGRMLRSKHADESAGLAAGLEPANAPRIALTSPAFAEGDEIPARYCGKFIGENISPALTWGELPAGTTDLLIVIEDLDVPTTVPGLHLIAEIPARGGGVPDGALNLAAGDVEFLPNHRGVSGYTGPARSRGTGRTTTSSMCSRSTRTSTSRRSPSAESCAQSPTAMSWHREGSRARGPPDAGHSLWTTAVRRTLCQARTRWMNVDQAHSTATSRAGECVRKISKRLSRASQKAPRSQRFRWSEGLSAGRGDRI